MAVCEGHVPFDASSCLGKMHLQRFGHVAASSQQTTQKRWVGKKNPRPGVWNDVGDSWGAQNRNWERDLDTITDLKTGCIREVIGCLVKWVGWSPLCQEPSLGLFTWANLMHRFRKPVGCRISQMERSWKIYYVCDPGRCLELKISIYFLLWFQYVLPHRMNKLNWCPIFFATPLPFNQQGGWQGHIFVGHPFFLKRPCLSTARWMCCAGPCKGTDLG